MYMDVLLTCMYINMHVSCPEASEIPGTVVMDGCKLPCGYWESNPDPPQEHQVLLAT